MTATVTFAGHRDNVACRPDETLLRAGLRAGLALPYECASGGCGSCRAQLVDGEVQTLWADAVGLTERDRRRGNRILMCQSIPVGECTVKAPVMADPRAVREPLPDRVSARLVGREMLSSDTALFTLDFGAPLEFLPGQFMLLESPSGVRRAYSMAHPIRECDSAAVEFIIRAKPDGAASTWLFDDIDVGNELTVEGPYGRAYAQPGSDRPALCVAGGTGLAPILAIAEHLLLEQPSRQLDVYIGARSPGDMVLLDRLARLRKLGARVVASVEHPAAEWPEIQAEWTAFDQVRVGRVIDHVAADWAVLDSHDIYLAGPAGMVDAALRALVRDGGASADRVFFDRFIA